MRPPAKMTLNAPRAGQRAPVIRAALNSIKRQHIDAICSRGERRYASVVANHRHCSLSTSGMGGMNGYGSKTDDGGVDIDRIGRARGGCRLAKGDLAQVSTGTLGSVGRRRWSCGRRGLSPLPRLSRRPGAGFAHVSHGIGERSARRGSTGPSLKTSTTWQRCWLWLNWPLKALNAVVRASGSDGSAANCVLDLVLSPSHRPQGLSAGPFDAGARNTSRRRSRAGTEPSSRAAMHCRGIRTSDVATPTTSRSVPDWTATDTSAAINQRLFRSNRHLDPQHLKRTA